MGWGGDLTFFKKLPSNSLPNGKSFQIPPPQTALVKYLKVGPKKGTIKISPNKTLRSLFISVAASPNKHVPVTSVIICLTNQSVSHCVEYRNLYEKVHIL